MYSNQIFEQEKYGRGKTRHTVDATTIAEPSRFQEVREIEICEAWLSLPHNTWHVPLSFPSGGAHCCTALELLP